MSLFKMDHSRKGMQSRASVACSLASTPTALRLLAGTPAAWRCWRRCAQGASAALCLCSSDARDGNSDDAQKRAEHGTEHEYGGERQQES